MELAIMIIGLIIQAATFFITVKDRKDRKDSDDKPQPPEL